MGELDRITVDPAVMGGKACIRGLRVTVGMIVGQIGAGHGIDDLLAVATDAQLAAAGVGGPGEGERVADAIVAFGDISLGGSLSPFAPTVVDRRRGGNARSGLPGADPSRIRRPAPPP